MPGHVWSDFLYEAARGNPAVTRATQDRGKQQTHTRMRKSAASDHACKWICSTRQRILHLTVANMNSVVCRFSMNPVVDYFNRAVNMGKFVISHGAAWLSDKALFHFTRVTCKQFHCTEQNDSLSYFMFYVCF